MHARKLLACVTAAAIATWPVQAEALWNYACEAPLFSARALV